MSSSLKMRKADSMSSRKKCFLSHRVVPIAIWDRFSLRDGLVEWVVEKSMRNDWRLFFRATCCRWWPLYTTGRRLTLRSVVWGQKHMWTTCTVYSRSHAPIHRFVSCTKTLSSSSCEYVLCVFVHSIDYEKPQNSLPTCNKSEFQCRFHA